MSHTFPNVHLHINNPRSSNNSGSTNISYSSNHSRSSIQAKHDASHMLFTSSTISNISPKLEKKRFQTRFEFKAGMNSR